MNTLANITVTILTKNAAETLQSALESVRDFDEVLILDNGSTDQTLEIAARYLNVTIHHSPFIGFGPLHNLAIHLAQNDWIFSLDSDEVISEELRDKLSHLTLDKHSLYRVNRKNFFNHKWIRGAGWYPDAKVRLFHRETTQFTHDQVHEKVLENSHPIIDLKADIHHFSYRSIADFLDKMQHYSSLYALDHQHTKKSSFSRALFASLFAFFKCYFLKLGIRDGKEGFIIALYNSQTSFYKYLKLEEAHSKRKKRP
ncbi:MAG: glycosyltransferase family 2 protein [Simkaniaceae bacterium]|nr:glycosyltransferase family 2 protein [Simkaniaceae bacterium]